jgi:MFS family permease
MASVGFTVFLVCMTIGRSFGDRLVARLGTPVLICLACLIATSGLVLVLLCPWVPAVIFAFGLVGIGLSVPFPLVMSTAGQLAGDDPGALLARVTTWGYAGMLVGPTLIGFIAEHAGMHFAFVPVAIFCLLAALCAPATRIIKRGDQADRMPENTDMLSVK